MEYLHCNEKTKAATVIQAIYSTIMMMTTTPRKKQQLSPEEMLMKCKTSDKKEKHMSGYDCTRPSLSSLSLAVIQRDVTLRFHQMIPS